MMTESELIKKCAELGAFKAGCIDVADIIFEPELRKACEANFCGNFGKNHACPPGVGAADKLIARAKTYKRILVFQTVSPLEDSFDLEGMIAAKDRHNEIASQIDALFPEPHLQLTAGGCTLCKRCAGYDGLPCRHPDKAVSSLEAYCINVAKLAGKCGMKYINGQDTVTYFAGFLY